MYRRIESSESLKNPLSIRNAAKRKVSWKTIRITREEKREGRGSHASSPIVFSSIG